MAVEVLEERPKEAVPHPILDHSLLLRQASERLSLTCVDQEWRGWEASYRFRCEGGHEFSKRLRSLIKTVGCMFCREEAAWKRLQASAQHQGVTCLETRWLGTQSYHQFRCAHGHEWKRIGGYAARDASCPACSRSSTGKNKLRQDGLSRLQNAARFRGGDCLSQFYLGVDRHHRFRCDKNHEWAATGTKILAGQWCPTCSHERNAQYKLRPDRFSDLLTIAKNHGGELLDNRYQGLGAKYRIQCQAGHIWSTTGAILISGSWCLICHRERKRRLAILKAQELALSRGGKCFTTEYPGSLGKWHWLCHRGHSWHSALSSVKQGHWCRECANMDRISDPRSKARIRYQKVT